ncbi:HhH-GPD domain [Dillenia turbinata]|uniref:HhH-GPD domain n=1 Tax=Dillenia turbinata TaxID=194707 RepID=A0AAN8ZFD1_9MAGN
MTLRTSAAAYDAVAADLIRRRPQNRGQSNMVEKTQAEALTQPQQTTITETTANANANAQPETDTPSTSKIPPRPKKLRKLSPEAKSQTEAESPKPTRATAPKSSSKKQIVQVQPKLRQIPRIIARALSCEGEIEASLRHLRSADPNLSRLIDVHQPPTFDTFQTPFLALTKSILYQQLAYKAGTSIYTRFITLCGGEAGVLPENVLNLTPHQLRQIGVSGRKASYLHDLARKYQNGILSDSSIVEMDDKSLFTMLTMVNGIGSWSVHMFMIFSLHRPDVLPVNDLGVRKGVQLLHNLEQLPRPSQMEQLCEKWRPYRSVASWYMWRFVEAKGTPSTAAVVAASGSLQEQQQQQQQHQEQQQQQQPQLLESINSIINLGYSPFCFNS